MGCIFYATTIISYFLMFVGRNEQTSERKCSIFRLRGKLENINKEADKNSHGYWPYCLSTRLTDSRVRQLTNIHPNYPRGCSFYYLQKLVLRLIYTVNVWREKIQFLSEESHDCPRAHRANHSGASCYSYGNWRMHLFEKLKKKEKNIFPPANRGSCNYSTSLLLNISVNCQNPHFWQLHQVISCQTNPVFPLPLY